MGRAEKEVQEDTPGWRLRLLRRAVFDDSQSQFARRLGMSPSRLSQYEDNTIKLTDDIIVKLMGIVPGLTGGDWLKFGATGGLSAGLLDSLNATRAKKNDIP